MTTATAALDPAETIAVAMRDLYDQLREIVDRGPTDDPGLLDEIGRITGRIRRRITSARKKAEPAEPAEEKPVPEHGPGHGRQVHRVPTVEPPSVTPGGPRHAAPTADGSRPREAQSADAPTVPRHRAVTVPAARRSEEITVRVPRQATGKHRLTTPRLPLWVRMLVILLIVGGIALGTTASTWGFGMAPAGAAVYAAARRWSIHRPAAPTGGPR